MLGGWLLALQLFAGDQSTTIADFDGENPLAGWAFSRDQRFSSVSGALSLRQGHSGRGAALDYQFSCRAPNPCGFVAAVWNAPAPVKVKRKGAVAMWIRAAADVKLTLVVTAKNEGLKRYPFEVVTLENPAGEWRRVSIPLAAKSTGYGDETHTGAPEGRLTALVILVEPRYPQPVRGTVGFDDLAVQDSPDQSYDLRTDLAAIPPAPGATQLAPRLGVNIHAQNDTHALDLAREAGFQFVRADLLWRQVERNGAFRFLGADRLMSALDTRGLGALWILDYGHPQHGGERPQTPDDIAAFARFAEAAAAHFKGRKVRYEIWNEPNTERFWPPAPDPAQYAALLREAAAGIRRADPDAPIASGGIGRNDLPFLERVIDAGGAAGVSAIAVHPYRRAPPETLAADLPPVRDLIRTKLGAGVELWDSEWGYASYDYFSQNLPGDGHSAAGRKRQAVLAVRELLTVWELALPLAIWYDLHDDGDDPRNPEHNYGLLDKNGADKPAMAAIRRLAQLAASHRYTGAVGNLPDGLHVMRLESALDRTFVVWNDQPDAAVTLRVPAAGLRGVTDLLGESVKIRPDSHGIAEIKLSEAAGPLYITLSPDQ
jgi:hypothetical protein